MEAATRDNYALPLFALVDRHKVDLQSPQLPELAERLLEYLRAQLSLAALDARVEVLGRDPYLILNGVEPASLPRLLALADVQKTQLYRYRRESAEQATLTPIAVDPTAGEDPST
ncbi:MAG: hypothetical protein ACLFR7_07655 [Opitutales bacterium]